MKILQVYRSAPSDETKTLVEILNRDRDADAFDLNVDAPDYEKKKKKIFAADKTVCWW